MPVFVLTLLLLLLPASAAAQVYKCKGKSGETAYSEHPCHANAQPMRLREPPPAPPPSGNDASSDASPVAGEAATPDMETARSAERSCIASATATIYGPSNDRVSVLQDQLSALTGQLDGTTDPARAQALRTRMDSIRQAITREHGNAHAQMNNARRRCVEQHRPAP